jgi:hypothetical protein
MLSINDIPRNLEGVVKMEFIEDVIMDEDELTGASIKRVDIIDGNDDTFLVISTTKGVMVIDNDFNAVSSDFLNDMIYEFQPEDLYELELINDDTFEHFETVNEFNLNDLRTEELEALFKAVSIMLKK